MKIERFGQHVGRYPEFSLSHDSYSPALLQAARAIPGCYRKDNKSIIGSADAIQAAVNYLVNERGLNQDAFERQHLVAQKQEQGLRGYILDDRLRSYQRAAVYFLRENHRAILADDMGLGKTASAINAATSFVQSKRVLIVCPSYVRGVWTNTQDEGELYKWATVPAEEVFRCEGIRPTDSPLDPLNKAPLTTFEFVLCHYDILHAWAETLRKWNPEVVVFDECHFLMNPDTQRTKAAKSVSENAVYVWGLSGTPMTNRPRDLWGVLDTIVPGRFGKDFFPFGLRYCGGYKEEVIPGKVVWKFDGKSHLDELKVRLNHFMLRRTKSDVALELPAKTRQVIRVDVAKQDGKRGPIIIQEARGGLRAALAVAADAKLKDSAVPLIRSHLESGAKVIVASYRRAVAEYIAAECGGVVIHGGISHARREKTLHDLRGRDGSSLLCGTIDAMGTGIDLSYADVGVCVELTYEPHELLQWEARLHRFGQQNPVLIQYLIARGTTDELVADVVVSKLETLEASIGGFGETALVEGFKVDEDEIMKELYRRLGL